MVPHLRTEQRYHAATAATNAATIPTTLTMSINRRPTTLPFGKYGINGHATHSF